MTVCFPIPAPMLFKMLASLLKETGFITVSAIFFKIRRTASSLEIPFLASTSPM